MTNNRTVTCQHCKKELPPDHKGHCPSCGSNKILVKISVGGGSVRMSGVLRGRQKQKGFGKFIKEILQGWFPSRSPTLKKGVNLERIIDKEKDEYHEVVENAETGEIIREVHEPLSRHKH